MANRFIGYAVCDGEYGYFTIPIIETDEEIPSKSTDGNLFYVSSSLLNGKVNSISDIASKINIADGESIVVGDIVGTYPPQKLKLEYVSATDTIFLDVYSDNARYARGNLGSTATGYPNSPVLFKLKSHDNKYVCEFSRNNDPNIPAGKFEFLFTNSDLAGMSNDVRIVSNMIPLDGDYPSEPKQIVITPSFNYVSVPSVTEYTAKFLYDDGSEIEATSTNAKWAMKPSYDGNLAGQPFIFVKNDTSVSVVLQEGFTEREFRMEVSWEGPRYNITGSTTTFVGLSGNSEPYTPDINSSSSPSWTGGGGGNFGVVDGTPETSDPIAPFLPGIGTPSGSVEGSVSNSGLFVHYAMDGTSLKFIGDWLWADELGLVIAKEFISLLYGSPIESAISLMSYPFDIKTLRGIQINSQEIYWGGHASGVTAPAITNPYASIDWGTIQLTEFWGNFLDYAPHTKLELYLPWCTGFVPIDPNECLPGTLRVVTNIELAKGTCLHNVIGNDGRVIATHAGTCAKQLPLTALDTSGKALQLVTTAASAIVAGASGAAADSAASRAGDIYRQQNFGSVLDGDMTMKQYRQGMSDAMHRASSTHSGVAKRAENRALSGSIAAMKTPSSVQRSGSFSGASAGLGIQFPYLIISRPTQSVPAHYGHHYGYPSNIYTPLSFLRGYTEVGEIHLTGFVCTEEELVEIDSILKGGVIL